MYCFPNANYSPQKWRVLNSMPIPRSPNPSALDPSATGSRQRLPQHRLLAGGALLVQLCNKIWTPKPAPGNPKLSEVGVVGKRAEGGSGAQSPPIGDRAPSLTGSCGLRGRPGRPLASNRSGLLVTGLSGSRLDQGFISKPETNGLEPDLAQTLHPLGLDRVTCSGMEASG